MHVETVWYASNFAVHIDTTLSTYELFGPLTNYLDIMRYALSTYSLD